MWTKRPQKNKGLLVKKIIKDKEILLGTIILKKKEVSKAIEPRIQWK